MFSQIKKKVDQNLIDFANQINKTYPLTYLSPLLSANIKNFILRPGKRIRPILFVVGYKAYTKKAKSGLYRSALSMELLHDFMLIHDDIIDKSATRRGQPSMHVLFDNYLKQKKKVKFNGSDLAIVVGDVVYALAIETFLSIKEKSNLKEKALRNFTKAAAFTGSGEFIELIAGIKDLDGLKKSEIYKIYDYKTAFYTFSCPLSTGAILAGAKENQLNKLNDYGMYLGRAFQIRDDILGLFLNQKKTGKSTLSDLQEAKKTLLIFYTYKKSSAKNKNKIEKIFRKEKVNYNDLRQIQKLALESNALQAAQKDIAKLLTQSQKILDSLSMQEKYKKAISQYFTSLLSKDLGLSQHK